MPVPTFLLAFWWFNHFAGLCATARLALEQNHADLASSQCIISLHKEAYLFDLICVIRFVTLGTVKH
jgi:hypothetical protein